MKIGSTNKIVQPIYNQPDSKVNSASNLHLGISHLYLMDHFLVKSMYDLKINEVVLGERKKN